MLIADIEDTAILGLGFLSGVNAKIDLVQQQLVINGEKIYCCSEDGKSLSLWCVTRRVVTIEPHCETVIPIHLQFQFTNSPLDWHFRTSVRKCQSRITPLRTLWGSFGKERSVRWKLSSLCRGDWPCAREDLE